MSAGTGDQTADLRRPPTWLYYGLSLAENASDRWTAHRKLWLFDRPGPPSWWTSAELRRMGTSSLASDDERFGSDVAVIARPWGARRALRDDPDHPENRAALRAMVQRWAQKAFRRESSGLWFVPGWALDAWTVPRFASLPTFASTFASVLTGLAGPIFRPGLTKHAVELTIRGAIEPLGERIVSIEIAGPSYAPGIIRAGTVLDAQVKVRGGVNRPLAQDAADTAALRATYLGCVIEKVPRYPGPVLPGEPLEDIRDRTMSEFRRCIEPGARASRVTEQRAGTPGLIHG